MFGRMMNNYYYGKSGKGDFRKEDLPQNRKELFSATLRTRLSALFRINLMYMLIFLPMMIMLMYFGTTGIQVMSQAVQIETNDYAAYTESMKAAEQEVRISEEEYNKLKADGFDYRAYAESLIFRMLIWLIPCFAITGPFTAGLSYVTRNWARDEHAFIWTDFKDAMKANWKQSLVLSVITSVLPMLIYVGWTYYGKVAEQNMILIVPQALVVLVGLIWAISITYMHPLAVTYELKMKDVIRNGLLLGVARLPMSVGIRLLHCIPLAIGAAVFLLWNPMFGMLGLFGYYFLIGFALSRFVTASYTNAVFDKYINSRIEGTKVEHGIYHAEEDEDEDEEDAIGGQETAGGEEES